MKPFNTPMRFTPPQVRDTRSRWAFGWFVCRWSDELRASWWPKECEDECNDDSGYVVYHFRDDPLFYVCRFTDHDEKAKGDYYIVSAHETLREAKQVCRVHVRLMEAA